MLFTGHPRNRTNSSQLVLILNEIQIQKDPPEVHIHDFPQKQRSQLQWSSFTWETVELLHSSFPGICWDLCGTALLQECPHWPGSRSSLPLVHAVQQFLSDQAPQGKSGDVLLVSQDVQLLLILCEKPLEAEVLSNNRKKLFQ